MQAEKNVDIYVARGFGQEWSTFRRDETRMRTDTYDRFCIRLEKHFTRAQIEQKHTNAGFEQISDAPPSWCAVGVKSSRGRPV